MSEEKPETGEVSPDPFAEGVDRLRETAKWVMTVFAAIAATLLAETSLSSIGQFSWGAPRLTAALIAGTLALFAVGVVIWHAARVLAPSPVWIQRLAEDEEKNRKPADVNFVQRNPQLLAGYGSVRELRDTYYGQVEERDALIEQDKWDDAKKRDDRIAYLGGVISQLLSAVAADRVHRQFKRTVWVMFVAGFVAAAGIFLFVWAANPPAPKQEKPAASGQALLWNYPDLPSALGFLDWQAAAGSARLQSSHPGPGPLLVGESVLHGLGEIGVSHQLRQLPNAPGVGLQEPRPEQTATPPP